MLVRFKNPMSNLTREQKIGIGVGVGTVLVLSAIAIAASAASKTAPRKAITVTDGCTSYTINNVQMIEDDIRKLLRSEAKRGPIDPLDLTRRYLSRVAAGCGMYPGPSQLPMVRLFAAIYATTLNIMQQEGQITAEEYLVWDGMFLTWAAGQGVSREDITG